MPAREVDHDLVELAAGGADVVVLDRLGEVDDAHLVAAELEPIEFD
jgi:NAD(P)-dependent dehydrogenase (short-subunit alcohol dehydrogenase family)